MSLSRFPWVQTISGRRVDLLDPDPADIGIDDIAWALSRIPRFNGHTRFAYSVAQHCVLGAQYLHHQPGAKTTRNALIFLLHDAHEAYIGDITTPAAEAFCDARLHVVKYHLDCAIWKAVTGEVWTTRLPLACEVADIDLRMLRTERDQLCAPPPQSWGAAIDAAVPIPTMICEHTGEQARQSWLAQLSLMRRFG